MAFELAEFNEVRLATVTNRVEKHGHDDKPAITLHFELETENELLDSLDESIRKTLWKVKGGDAQERIEGVPEAYTVLACNSIKSVSLPNKHEGWVMEIDHNGNEDEAFKMGKCKLSKFSFEPKQGGAIVLKFSVGTSDVNAEKLGWIGMHNGDQIWIRLLAPKKQEPAIDGSTQAFQNDHPLWDGTGEQPDAADVFAENEAAGLNSDAPRDGDERPDDGEQGRAPGYEEEAEATP